MACLATGKEMDLKIVPTELENNAYAKFWKDSKEYLGICEKRPIQTFKASKVIKARLLLLSKKICLWTKRNFVWLVGKERNISPVVIWRIYYSYVKSWVTRFSYSRVMKSREVHNIVKKFSKGTYYSVIWSFFIVFMLKRKQRKTCKWP